MSEERLLDIWRIGKESREPVVLTTKLTPHFAQKMRNSYKSRPSGKDFTVLIVVNKMKIPPEIDTYCSKCNKYTPHTVSVYKAGKRRSLARGERHHERVDRHGYGGSKAPVAKPVKTTKKIALKLKCRTCGRTIVREGLRIKKLEIKVG